MELTKINKRLVLCFSLCAVSIIAAAALPCLQRPNLRSQTVQTSTAAVAAENRSEMMNWINQKKTQLNKHIIKPVSRL